MQFGKHIGKGLWAFGDKALPAVYGVGFVVLVARVLPSDEYGLFVIVQSIANIVSAIVFTVALQPLIKYISEYEISGAYVTTSFYIQITIVAGASLILLLFASPLSAVLDDGHRSQLTELLRYLPLMLGAGLMKNFGSSMLQSTYEVAKIFWVDSIAFVGMLLSYLVYQWFGIFDGARDLIVINVLMNSFASVVAYFLIRDRISLRFALHRQELRKMLRFGKYMFGGSVSYTLFSQFDVLFLSYFSGAVAVAGYFNAKIFVRLFEIVSQVLQMFLMPFSARSAVKGEFDKMVVVAEKAICFSMLLLFPVSLLMIAFPSELLAIVYGGRYSEAAPAVRILGFLIVVYPPNAVFSNYIIGIGRAREGFYFGMLTAIVAVPLYFVLGKFYEGQGIALAFLLTLAFSTVLSGRFLRSVTPIKVSPLSTIMRVADVLEFVKARTKAKP